MRKVYAASIIWKGVLGGGIITEDDKMTYRTGKLLIPEKYCDIQSIICGRILLFPTIEVVLPEESYKFIVFNRKGLLNNINLNHLRKK